MSQHTMIPISGDEIPVVFDDVIEFVKARQHWHKQVESRLRNPLKSNKDGYDPYVEDAFLRIRQDTEGREYYEWVSKEMGYAVKRMSQSTDKKAEFPYYIAFMTPWTRWDKANEQNLVLYSQFQLENGEEKLEKYGFSVEDAGQWVPAKRVKDGDSHVWKAL